MISTFENAFPTRAHSTLIQMYNRALIDALQVYVWDTDYHLFAFTLPMNIIPCTYNAGV